MPKKKFEVGRLVERRVGYNLYDKGVVELHAEVKLAIFVDTRTKQVLRVALAKRTMSSLSFLSHTVIGNTAMDIAEQSKWPSVTVIPE